MPELDDRLRLLRRQARGWAAELRPYALDLDRDPDVVLRLLDAPAVTCAAHLQIPAAFNPTPLVLAGERFHLTAARERVVFCEEIARGDLGMMLALPGASMSGVLVAAIGDRAQQEWFYGRLLERPTWTFFALTEPGGGTDAAGLRTRATESADGSGWRLTGRKRYISNALRASVGVVFHRTGDGPLGLGAALVDTSSAGFTAVAVPTLGVRGAQLGALTLDAVPITDGQLLGRHLSPMRRGSWGWQRTFNLLRPTVAAMAVGLAQAACDYVREHRRALRPAERDALARTQGEIEGVRRLTRLAAVAVDSDSGSGHLASAAKLRATRLAADVSRWALRCFGPGARLDQPLLDKFARDAAALEFMEGTGNVQRLAVAAALDRGAFAGYPPGVDGPAVDR
ncbi:MULTISPECIES: acyl-CoA dehydrogenase family protein [Micromonospora]|uniref:Acyl-CoA/acyl-ACP dehydrogenase n=1 Tax=Micromonospora humidisoli TaxID=2807622 RepID=A0ABS2JBI7_9ACTN|nr:MULTISPECIES: acyl-CoA dehydrogenase family protein [Micromonospora]MBM7083833.1 acyl-CoA/acyl-ACP dehydrogenase [Micromonospora humidisoli]WKU07218.1 acyl-CoA dehydrogenase family protein [Micromonospora sp. HUAS LYJ1]GHJ06949.1 acyl-CoA dehydrogenase [Micromonospora sp. AKA109]